MPWSEHKQTASAFARNDVEIKLQDALLCSVLQMATCHALFLTQTPPCRPYPTGQVTQIQCVCNLCGIAQPESANHANKHQAAIGQRALGSWHKKH